MEVILGQIIKWSKTNEMNINCDKTKEMILGTVTVQPPALYVDSNYAERVQAFKLLGVIVGTVVVWNGVTMSITFVQRRHLDCTGWNC